MTQPESQRCARREPLHPGLHTNRCELALPDPSDAESSVKTIDGSLPRARSDAVLDEKAPKPQCQKIVRWADLIDPWEGRRSLHVIASQRVGAKRRPVTGSAKQSILTRHERMDCFVACAPRNDVRVLLRILAARFARGMPEISHPLQKKGAGNAGRPMRPRSRVQ